MKKTTPRRARLRAIRKLAERQTRVAMWWASLPAPKPESFTPLAMHLALDTPLRAVAASLRALGWRRIVRRTHGKYIVLWLPPGSPVQPRPVGRQADPLPKSLQALAGFTPTTQPKETP